MAIEIGISQDGDWAISDHGTMTLVGNDSYVMQKIMMLIRTEPGDMTYNPVQGFAMANYLSMPNKQATADALISDLHSAITSLPDLQGYDVNIDAFPTAMDMMTLTIDVISPDGTSNRMSQDLSFGAGAASRFGYTITDHTPYDSTTSRPMIEIFVLDAPSRTVELAHRPLNSFVRIFDDPDTIEFSGNTLVGSSTTLSGHVTTPTSLQYDLSGNPFSGATPSTSFIATTDTSGNFVLNTVSVDGIFTACTIVDSIPSFSDFMFNNSPSSAAIYVSGNLIVETPDLNVSKATMTSLVPVTDFDLVMTYPDALAEAVSVTNSVVELNKNSVAFGGRSTYRWFVQLPVTLAAGRYAAVYNTFDYR
jgi:hypothetical protein